MSKNESSDFLGTANLFPLLIKLSIPAVVGMLVGSFYNIVDTIFVGRGAGTLAITALAIAFPIQMVVMAFAQMIGVGGASVISRCLGAGEQKKAEKALGTSVTMLIILSIIMTIVSLLFPDFLLKIFGATEKTLPYAKDYLIPVSWGFIFLSISIAGSNIIRAEGKANTAMLTMVLGMVVNIILDPVFIFGFDMGIAGAAYATVIGQFCSTVWVVWFFVAKRGSIHLKSKYLKINWNLLRGMTMLGLPNFIQTAGMSILTLIVNNALLIYSGEMAIGIFGIINKLISFVIMPVVGISQGFQPIAGYNYGAKKYDRVKKILILASISATVVAGFFSLIMELMPYKLISIFTTDAELINTGASALRIMVSLITLMGLQVIFSIYFQAVGKGLHALFLGLSRQFIILIPLILILPKFWGANGVWLSFPISDILSTIITAFVLKFELAHLDDKHSDSLTTVI